MGNERIVKKWKGDSYLFYPQYRDFWGWKDFDTGMGAVCFYSKEVALLYLKDLHMKPSDTELYHPDEVVWESA